MEFTSVPLSPFWAAFSAGLAAPVSLYAPSPDYTIYANVPSPATSFAAVARRLTQPVVVSAGSVSDRHALD